MNDKTRPSPTYGFDKKSKSWYYPFTENMIDEEAFLLLEESALKEMISAVGPRLKFQRKLQQLQVHIV